MSRARELAKLGNTDAIGIDGVDLRAGSITKGTTLDVASNVNVTGVITATNFIGNASGLTGLGAVGSGVTVLRAGNSLGAITKLNFDNTFNVTDPAAGLSTITSGVTTADPRSSSLVVIGVTTLANTNAGILTANQFSGPLTGVAVTLTGTMSAVTASVTGQSTLSNLNVSSGIATVAGQTTLSNLNVASGIASVAGQTNLTHLNVSGVTTSTEINASDSIEVVGFVTATNGGISVTGVVTATSFVGTLTGIATGSTQAANSFGFLGSPSIVVTGLNATGVATVGNTLDVNASADISGNLEVGSLYAGITTVGEMTATEIEVSGIITATAHVDAGITTYYGDNSYSASMRWVLAASGTDHYVFTGPGFGHSTANDPTLYLKRGQTYMFENKMGAHPFRIQSTTNGSTGTQWNVGVTNNDVSNGVLIFEVPFVTPSTLYYQCTVHAAMGGVINIT